MKRPYLQHGFSYVLGALFLVATSGCDEEFATWRATGQSRFERPLSRQIALETIDTLDVTTRSGAIAVTGTDAADCCLEARIVAYAPTEQEAQDLAEQVQIVEEAAGGTLKIRSHEPALTNNRSISVSYTISVPRRMNVRCDSNYGSLDVSNIGGRLDGKSGNGSIKARDIQGPADLDTNYGAIECRNVVGQSISLRSNNGSITAAGLRGSTTAETSYGAISCEDFADGDLKLKSGNGKIEIANASFGVCETRSSFGVIAGRNLKGDSITLNSGNGSVEIDNVQTKTLNLFSSFGNLRATGVTASDISATSGNGGVHIACSPSTPSDLDARVRSTFGSVEFTAPAGFAGEVSLSTGFGSVQTALPVTVSGEISRSRASGKVGDGAGKIRIESGNGSVELK